MTHELDLCHPFYERFRTLVASLPEGAEKEAWGHPTFRAGKKMFAAFAEHQGRPSISVKQTIFDQEDLLVDPRFFSPPYSGVSGWVGIYLDDVEWEIVEDLALSAYRLVALKRMLKALDA